MAEEKKKKKKTEDWELDPEDIKVIEAIGHGSTASVYWATLHGHDVAVKEIQAVSDSTLVAVRRELQVMNKAEHPHLLKMLGLVSRTPPLRLCLEFCSGGTLFDLLHNRWHILLRWTRRTKMLLDLASVLDYLHNFRRRIIHRDLKSLNVFLLYPVEEEDQEIQIKLGDFGCARIQNKSAASCEDWSEMTQGAGSLHWMAPEVYLGTKYSVKADVFSYGVVMYEVICRHMAFEEECADVAGKLLASNERPTLEFVPASCPPELPHIMQQCWNQLPEDRPLFNQICAELEQFYAAMPETPADC